MEDLSALIFVALAVAWAAYLIPKALQHHEEAARSRSVDRFSRSLRVLARREPVDRQDARLVLTPQRASGSATVGPEPAGPHRPAAPPATAPELPTAVASAARRGAATRATRRRRRVLGLLLVALAATAGAAWYGVLPRWYVAVPGGLLVAWLVTCRVMVRGERRQGAARRAGAAASTPAGPSADRDAPVVEVSEVPDEIEVSRNAQGFDEVAAHAETSTLAATPGGSGSTLWDPVPVTLPTYVTKSPAARRTVRTIDLDEAGVWTSGRTAADSRLVQDAEQASRTHAAAADDKRVVGG